MRNITFIVICLACLVSCQKTKELTIAEDDTFKIYGSVKECVEEVFRAHIKFGDTIPDDSCFQKRIIRFDKDGRELYYFVNTPSWDGSDTTMAFYDYYPSGLIAKRTTIKVGYSQRLRIDERYNYSTSGKPVFKIHTSYDTLRSIVGKYKKPETYDTIYGYYFHYDSIFYEYDDRNNLIKEGKYSQDRDTTRLDYLKRYKYDSKNREVAGSEYDTDGTLIHTWEITYSPDGAYILKDSSRLIKEKSPEDYYRYIKEHRYNSKGQMIYCYKNSHYNKGHYIGNHLYCRYNAFYKEKLQYTKSGKLSSVEAYEYDLRAQAFKDESWIIQFEYDQNNHLIRVDKPRFLPWYVMQDPYYKSLTYIEPRPNILKKDKYNWTEEISHSEITKRTISYWK